MIHWPSSMQLIPWWSFGCEFHGFGFCDEELEGLMAAAAAESDPEARRQALTEMHNSIMEVVPYVPLYRERGLTVVSRRLHNVYPMPIDNYGWNAHTWWVDG
jgi:ABC-type transport system substrate-binding protein